MSTSNPWLTPFQRSYNDIKAKLIQSLNERVPEITDMSEGNIFILTFSDLFIFIFFLSML